MGTTTSPALGGLELRDKTFDLALAVIAEDRATREQPDCVPALRIQMRDMAKQLMVRIARDGTRA